MKITINPNKTVGKYIDPTVYQNSTLRYAPPKDFPEFLERELGRAKIMRVWITLDEYWDYKTGTFYPDYDIGVKRYPDEQLHYLYDWKKIVPAPSETKFVDYLTSHAKCADDLMLNIRRLEREVSDGVISYDKYEEIVFTAIEYCKKLAPNIKYIECCNEIELKPFGDLTAEEYVKIYLRAYSAVKRLNDKYDYPIKLEIGGYGVAHPLFKWDIWAEILKRLKEAMPGEKKVMDFYSFHEYDLGSCKNLRKAGKDEFVDNYGPVGRLKIMMENHRRLLSELKLPELPLFWDEIGITRASGELWESLYNAAGNMVYLTASADRIFDNVYFFPWCTFHNPILQMSYTQFLLNSDGSYSATPNGIAMLILHKMNGDRVATEISQAEGFEPEYRAMAVKNDDCLYICAVNPTEITDDSLIDISLDYGKYQISQFLCDSTHNNCVTGYGNGKLEATDEFFVNAEKGSVTLKLPLEKHAFVMYIIKNT